MDKYSDFKVGDMVWWSDVNSRNPWSGAVLKVGPKLITVSYYSRKLVFRRESGTTNDEYQHQTLIADLEVYEADKKADIALSKLRQKIAYTRNEGVGYEDILEAARLLKVNID